MAKILGLADGEASFYPRATRGGSGPRFIRSVRRPAFPPGYIQQLGDSLERLAGMTLARKLANPAPISGMETDRLLSLAGVPNTPAGRMLSARILTASASDLGKGGVIGSITSAVSTVAKKVVQPVAKVVEAAAPILSKVPVIGPAVATIVGAAAKAADSLAQGGIKNLTQGGVTGLIGKFGGAVGAVVGTGVAVAGSVVEGVVEAPVTIVEDLGAAASWVGSYLGGGGTSGGVLSSILAGGKSLASSFSSSVASTIESVDPSLSGELSSIFKGMGAGYTSFASTFDDWSRSMKNAPTNTVKVGNVGGNLYTMIKDATGHFNVTQSPTGNLTAALASLPLGSLLDPSQLPGLGTPVPPAGAGYNPKNAAPAAGKPISPAGASLPGGPIAVSGDQTSLALLSQASNQANAGLPAAPAPDAMLAGFPLWAVAGLGVAALALLLKPSGGGGYAMPMMSMGQGWQLPAGPRPVRNRPRRRKR